MFQIHPINELLSTAREAYDRNIAAPDRFAHSPDCQTEELGSRLQGQ